MKTLNTLNSILVLICFLFMNAASLSAQQWVASSELPNQYQAVKPYIAEGDPAKPEEGNLTEEEKAAVIAATQNTLDQIEKFDSLTIRAENSSSMENGIVQYEANGHYAKNSKPGDVKMIPGDLTNGPGNANGQVITPPDGKYGTKPPVPSPPSDILGFLATQNESPLQAVGTAENAKKNLLQPMTVQASVLEVNPAVSVNPVAVQVVDSVQFNDKVRMIYELLNPPGELHPWLKWLLYSNRVTKEMLKYYNETLKKRDDLYQKALTSNGKLAIMYRNRIFKDIPIYVMPEWASGEYSLVSVGMENNLSTVVAAQMPVS